MREDYDLAEIINNMCVENNIACLWESIYYEDFLSSNNVINKIAVVPDFLQLRIGIETANVISSEIIFDFEQKYIHINPDCKINFSVIKNLLQSALLFFSEKINKSLNNQIYKITNKLNGMCYIGKSCNTSELRWISHVKNGNTKISKVILQEGIQNFIFEVIEIVEIPNTIYLKKDVEDYVISIERKYINKFNSIKNGYNSRL